MTTTLQSPSTAEHLPLHGEGVPILTPTAIDQMGITELSQNLGVKVDFSANPADLKNSLKERHAHVAGSLVSLVRDYINSNSSNSGVTFEVAQEQTEAVVTPVDPEEGIITYFDISETDEEPAVSVEKSLAGLKSLESAYFTEAKNTGSDDQQDKQKDTDKKEKDNTPEHVTIEVPQELEDFFQASVVDYVKTFAKANGTVKGVFGTAEEPNEQFKSISETLINHIKQAATNKDGVVDENILRLLKLTYNTRIAQAYQEAEAEVAVIADNKLENKVTTPISEAAPTPTDEKPQTIESDTKLVASGKDILSDEEFDRQVDEEVKELIATFEAAKKEGKVENSAEGVASIVLTEVRKFAKANKTETTTALGAYKGSAFQGAVAKVLTWGYQNKYKDVADKEKMQEYFKRDIQLQHRAINGELLRVDEGSRVKRALGRIAGFRGKQQA